MIIDDPSLTFQLGAISKVVGERFPAPRIVFGGCFAAGYLAHRAEELLGVPKVDIPYGDIDCYVRHTHPYWAQEEARCIVNLPPNIQVILGNPAYRALRYPLMWAAGVSPESPAVSDSLTLYKLEDSSNWRTDMVTRAASHLDLYDLAVCQAALWVSPEDGRLNAIYSDEYLVSLVTKRLNPTKRHLALITELLQLPHSNSVHLLKLFRHLGITTNRLVKYWDRTHFMVPEEFFEKTCMVLEAIRDHGYMAIGDMPDDAVDAYGVKLWALSPALYERFNVPTEGKCYL